MAKSSTQNYTIRGVSPETKTAIKKAAKKQKKTIAKYFNEDIREMVQGQLKSTPLPPMKIEDLAADIEQLKQQFNKLNERPKTLWGLLFGQRPAT